MSRAQQAYRRRLEGATIAEIMAEFGWTESSTRSLISRGKHWAEWSARNSMAEKRAARDRKVCAEILAGGTFKGVAATNKVSIQTVRTICAKAGVKRPVGVDQDRAALAQICDLAAV